MNKKFWMIAIILLASSISTACSLNTDTNTADVDNTMTEDATVEENLDIVDENLASIPEIVIASTQDNPAEFTILLAALENANPSILEALSTDGPFTVFAPTDAAFGDLLTSLGLTAEELLGSTDVLNNTLLYHVVLGEFLAWDIMILDWQEITTLLEDTVSINVTNENVVINNNATVVSADIDASNGVIHVIDQVLVPAVVNDLLGVTSDAVVSVEESEAIIMSDSNTDTTNTSY